MERTYKQIITMVQRIDKKSDNEEDFYSSLVGFWSRYDLTEEQCNMLNNIKNAYNSNEFSNLIELYQTQYKGK